MRRIRRLIVRHRAAARSLAAHRWMRALESLCKRWHWKVDRRALARSLINVALTLVVVLALTPAAIWLSGEQGAERGKALTDRARRAAELLSEAPVRLFYRHFCRRDLGLRCARSPQELDDLVVEADLFRAGPVASELVRDWQHGEAVERWRVGGEVRGARVCRRHLTARLLDVPASRPPPFASRDPDASFERPFTFEGQRVRYNEGHARFHGGAFGAEPHDEAVVTIAKMLALIRLDREWLAASGGAIAETALQTSGGEPFGLGHVRVPGFSPPRAMRDSGLFGIHELHAALETAERRRFAQLRTDIESLAHYDPAMARSLLELEFMDKFDAHAPPHRRLPERLLLRSETGPVPRTVVIDSVLQTVEEAGLFELSRRATELRVRLMELRRDVGLLVGDGASVTLDLTPVGRGTLRSAWVGGLIADRGVRLPDLVVCAPLSSTDAQIAGLLRAVGITSPSVTGLASLAPWLVWLPLNTVMAPWEVAGELWRIDRVVGAIFVALYAVLLVLVVRSALAEPDTSDRRWGIATSFAWTSLLTILAIFAAAWLYLQIDWLVKRVGALLALPFLSAVAVVWPKVQASVGLASALPVRLIRRLR